MAATARGSQHAAYRVLETAFTVAPENPAFLQFRQAGFKLNVERDTIVSKEITDTRHIKNVVYGSKKVIGDASAELCYGSHDDLLEAALMGTWAPKATKTATTISFSASDNSINDSGNGFVTAGFRVGDKIRTTGASNNANNATRVATAVAAGKITFGGTDGDSIVDEAAAAAVTVRTRADVLKSGTTSRTLLIERHHKDVGVLLRYTGVKIGKFGFKVAPNGTVDLTFSFIGSDGTLHDLDDDKLTGATYEESANTDPMVSSRGVITEDGVPSASVSELSFDLDNGVEGEYVVGKDTSNEPTEGDSNLKGSMTMLFKDDSLLQKWFNLQEDAFTATFTDAAGNAYIFNIPRIALMGAPTDVTGKGSIPITAPFQAMLDAAEASNIVITRIPAA